MSSQNFVAIGSDPEVFVMDPSGKVVPITGLVGGTKKEPLALGNGYAVQEDGVALEYNIPVCTSAVDFINSVNNGLKLASAKLPAGYGTMIKPDHEFSADQLTDPSAWVSGCDPDFSAWTMEKREGLNYEKTDKPLVRYCGGHVHISYPNAKDMHPMTKMYLVRLADMLMGVPARWLEGDSIRSQEFGTFGIYRPKSYGLEYRTMSNIWLKIPELMSHVAECSLFLATKAGHAERLNDFIYHRDVNRVPVELEKFLSFTPAAVQTWEKTVRNTGFRVSKALSAVLLQKLGASAEQHTTVASTSTMTERHRFGQPMFGGNGIPNIRPVDVRGIYAGQIEAQFLNEEGEFE